MAAKQTLSSPVSRGGSHLLRSTGFADNKKKIKIPLLENIFFNNSYTKWYSIQTKKQRSRERHKRIRTSFCFELDAQLISYWNVWNIFKQIYSVRMGASIVVLITAYRPLWFSGFLNFCNEKTVDREREQKNWFKIPKKKCFFYFDSLNSNRVLEILYPPHAFSQSPFELKLFLVPPQPEYMYSTHWPCSTLYVQTGMVAKQWIVADCSGGSKQNFLSSSTDNIQE